jgi:predicted DNA-binding transcriptional regulator YafY
VSRSTRLLATLQALRGRRGPVTAAALAGALGVSERTIYRDIADLRTEGAPIQGEAGLGYVLRPGMFLPPLRLNQDETEAVMLGLRYVAQRGDDVLVKASDSARAKIATMLSHEGQGWLDAPEALPGPDNVAFSRDTVPLAVMRAAIRERTRLRIDYVDRLGRPTQRIIWPIQIGFADQTRVLAAWCELRGAFRFVRQFRQDLLASGHSITPDKS